LFRNKYEAGWVAWLLGFVALEGLAVANKDDEDTLSETVWRWFSINHEGKHYRIRRFGLLTLITWLFWHFWTGGKKV